MSNYNNEFNITPAVIRNILWGIGVVIVFIISMAFIRPWYNVWSQEMEGKAEFAKAEQNRKIKIEERAPTLRPRSSMPRRRLNERKVQPRR